MFVPTKENYTEMTDTEFEQYILATLNKQFQDRGVGEYSFNHNVHIEAYDSTYQIDGVIKLSVMGTEIIILVECKKYKGPIKRELIQVLHDKIRSTGAHKGIFVTTSYYQSGALKYAKEHGIALISIIDGKMRYAARSGDWEQNPTIPYWVEINPFSMAMQTQTTDNIVSVSYIDDTDALFQFVVENT